VEGPSTSHEVQWGKIEIWIQSAGKPNEQGMKARLKELLRVTGLATSVAAAVAAEWCAATSGMAHLFGTKRRARWDCK
jgi:hypothetical protein